MTSQSLQFCCYSNLPIRIASLLLLAVWFQLGAGMAQESNIRTNERKTEAPGEPSVRVFILAGQSNMCGHGVVSFDHPERYNNGRGNLVNVMKLPRNKERMKHLADDEGKWIVRDDVFVWHKTKEKLKTGPLTIGFSSYRDEKSHFGPELQFGHVVGEAFDEPVLLIKTAWGGKSLQVDFRPPSAGGATGPYFQKMLEEIEEAMGQARTVFSPLKNRKLVLSGFVWQQGWNDMIDEQATKNYTENLTRLIKDIRDHFEQPELPFVIGELGNGGKDAGQNLARFRKAQSRIVGRSLVNVRFVPTAEFALPADESPNTTHLHHWFGNAESYFMVGDSLGAEMVRLIKEQRLPKVLILGDSISIGYTPFVKRQLKDRARVFRPMRNHRNAENCAGTDYGIQSIDRWLKIDGGDWDVIHFNFGLHDLKRVDANGKNSNDPKDDYQSGPEDYEKQLREIVGKLKGTGAKLIFATTTPVPGGDKPVRPYRDPTDPVTFNEIGRRVALDNQIEINDLFDFANERLEQIQQPNNVHFHRSGSEQLGKQVANIILRMLNKDDSE